MAKKKDDDKPQPKTCSSCNGRGVLTQRMTRPDGSTFVNERKCSTCGGKGKVW